MKRIFLLLLTACLLAVAANAQKKTFVRDYIYQASEADSKLTARKIAIQEMQTLLLMEIGQALQSEQALKKLSVTKDGKETFSESFSQEVMAITAGFVEMKILDESWNGKTYYIEARMTVDPKEVSQRVAEVLNNRQKDNAPKEAKKEELAKQAYLAKEVKKKAVEEFSAEEYFSRGLTAQNNQWHEFAIENYQKAVSANPSYAAAYNNMGLAYRNLNSYAQAINCYQKAVSIDPSFAFAYNNMGYAYYQQGNYAQAISCYQKALSIDPNFAFAYNNMGDAYIEVSNYTQAISAYQKAARLGHGGAKKWLKKKGYKW